MITMFTALLHNKANKKPNAVIGALLLLLFACNVIAQPYNIANFRIKLEKINRNMASSLIGRRITPFLTFFEKDAVCMPEYQKSLNGLAAISAYYQQLAKEQTIILYKKNITELIPIGHNLAEIGTFTKALVTANGKQYDLDGKYFNLWLVHDDDSLTLKCESFGYYKNIDDPQQLLVNMSTKLEAGVIPKSINDYSNLEFQLYALNTLMEKSVKARDGNLRAEFFTEDAVFMPFADSSKIGIQSIKAHLIAYNNFPVIIDSIAIYNDYIEDCEEYVIEYPKFKVRWHTNDNAGEGSGKGVRIWRRSRDCSLRLYREIGLHDLIQ